MSEIISYAIVGHYTKNDYGRANYSLISSNEDNELVNKLFDYYDKLGIDKYEKYDTGEVRWRLNNRWYDDNQIERILRLAAFT